MGKLIVVGLAVAASALLLPMFFPVLAHRGWLGIPWNYMLAGATLAVGLKS